MLDTYLITKNAIQSIIKNNKVLKLILLGNSRRQETETFDTLTLVHTFTLPSNKLRLNRHLENAANTSL